MAKSSVLYDAPGPRAKARNVIYTVVFFAVLVAAGWWVITTLGDTDQLEGDKWQPFVEGSTWRTYLLPGLWETVKAAVLALILSLVAALLLAVGRLSDHPWVRVPSAFVVELFRSLPVLVLMIFFKQLYVVAGVGTPEQQPLLAVVSGLVFYNSAVLAEVIRAGVLSLPKGQTEAAQAIGLRKGQMMRMILLPQGLTAMLPAMVSQLVVIVKDTALGSIVFYPELLNQARPITNTFANPVATYVVIALIFVAINLILSIIASTLQRVLNRRRKGPKIDVTQAAGGLGAGSVTIVDD